MNEVETMQEELRTSVVRDLPNDEVRCPFDRETVIRLIMAQATSFFENGKRDNSIALGGVLVGIRSCLFYMDAGDEVERITDMIAELTMVKEQER
jgi:hypothetical protein